MNKKHGDSYYNGALLHQNHRYRGTGGISQNNQKFKFIPAFYDSLSRTVYLSCYANGRPAPVHVLEGLPENLLRNRVIADNLGSARNTLIAGFIFGRQFLTRQQAADVLAE